VPSKGLDLNEYISKLSNETYALRTGSEVPEGDVNLAYIHTPALDSDENVSLLDMTSTPDNVIPEEQLESIVYSDKQGKLHYAHIVQEYDPVVEKPPYDVFASKDVKITREFKKNEHKPSSALYYKFDLKYHFDSKEGIPNKVERYTGQQIEITDEQGNPLDDTFKYEIYVMAMEKNPNIHWVRIYLHDNTDEEQTFKVRYNHVESILPSDQLTSVRKEIQLYANQDNAGVIEGGKLRIINGVGAFDELDDTKFANALEDDEVYKAKERTQGDGYELYVPQKSEDDPRAFEKFNYKVTATYTNSKGKQQKVTVGYINDWVMNQEALLEHEKLEFSKEWKQLGVPNDNFKLNINQMVELSLPIGTPSMPQDTVYEITDATGTLLYTATSSSDNPNVLTNINDVRGNYAEAKALNNNTLPWKNALKKNVRLKSKAIPHNCSIIAEQQKTKWDFSWKATGQGVIKTPLVYNANWWACANVGVYKGFTTSPLDVANKSKWTTIGTNVTLSDWKVDSGKLELKVNELDIGGFYQLKAPDGSDMFQKDNYEFSARVKIIDPGDDDVIGLVFRVKNSKEYYMFAWEKEQHPLTPYYYKASDGDGSMAGKSNGPARILMGSGGITAFYYDGVTKAFPESQFSTDSADKYLNQMGFAKNKKRIFKVKPRSGAGYSGYYPGYQDVTGVSFTDITTKGTIFNSSVGKVGWQINKDYKITVVTTGNHYQIYINENAASTERGTLVCESTDSTYMKGSCGIFCVSQRWAQWSKLVYNEIDVTSVCTDHYPLTLDSQTQVKVSPDRIENMMKKEIEEYAKSKYGQVKYEVFGYNAQSDKPDLALDIDENGKGFVWAQTSNSDAGGVKLDPFSTSDHGLDVFGTGTVQYHEDGEFTILSNPERLPTESIPTRVEEFRWNQPQLLTGQWVTLSLDSDGESIVVTGQIPPIVQLNKWVVLPMDEIRKDDGIVSLEDVFKPGGIYERLGISNIPVDEVLLRIERGSATAPFATTNPEHRVNYRFRVDSEGMIRMPVDQFQDQLGVNRIRLSSLFQTYKPVKFDINYKVLVPKTITTDMKDIFSRNAPGAVMIEKSPGDASWKLRDGMLVDDMNRQTFVAAYNSNHLNLKNHTTDFLFKPVGIDDDLVGVIFRVQDKNNFYFYAVEADVMATDAAAGRMSDVQPLDLQQWTRDTLASSASLKDFYENKGWKSYHHRIYKVESGKKSVVASMSTTYNKGWIRDWLNNIRIECLDDTTNVYFQSGLAEEDKWNSVFSVKTKWNKGSFGIFNFSQTCEFHQISNIEYEEVTGTIPDLEGTGNPVVIFADSTMEFCHSYVMEKLTVEGMNIDEDYLPSNYSVTKKSSEGNVLISANGQGPIQVFSVIDPTVRIGETDVVAWTHYEDLEAIPIFGIKIEERKKIEIEKPKVERTDMEIDNWYLRVKKGKFQRRIEIPYYEPQEKIPQIYTSYPQLVSLRPNAPDQSVEVILEYSLPEYSFQEFYDQPTILIERERPIILHEYAIQTRYAPIQLKSEFGISYLEVEALRKNHSRKLRISDVDAAKGIIYLHDRIREQDEVLVRYAYEEKWFTYTGFEKTNPSSNAGEFFHLDLNPSPGHRLTLAEKGIFKWIPLDVDAKTYKIVDEESKQLLVKPIHVYMRPQLIRDSNGTIISGTEKPVTVYHTDEEHWFNPNDYYHDPTVFRLAKVMLQANSRIDKDMIILDTRTRGGGLDEALSREIIGQVNKESLYHWDIGYFDGEAYQENGVMIVRLPRTILDKYHETEVQAAVAKHKTYGVLPIIEYYDVDKISQQDKNLLLNPEFYNGDHLSYHDSSHDKGDYKIEYKTEGTGDNYILNLPPGSRYGVTVPGYIFEKDRSYRVEIKARMDNNALPRKAADIEIHYQDGTIERYQTSFINHIDWMIYKKSFEIKRDVTKINIILNDDTAFGNVFVDYLLIFPHLVVDENAAEILEI
jgi:hypothetical protein